MVSRDDILRAYETLGLSEGASRRRIEKAWKERAKCWHPDKFTNAKAKITAGVQMAEINAARDVLRDVRSTADIATEYKESQSTAGRKYYTGTATQAEPTKANKQSDGWLVLGIIAVVAIIGSYLWSLHQQTVEAGEHYAEYKHILTTKMNEYVDLQRERLYWSARNLNVAGSRQILSELERGAAIEVEHNEQDPAKQLVMVEEWRARELTLDLKYCAMGFRDSRRFKTLAELTPSEIKAGKAMIDLVERTQNGNTFIDEKLTQLIERAKQKMETEHEK